MTAAVGRFGGWAVGVAVVLLTAQPLNRLTAQTEGSILTALPGSTRSAGLGGAGAALVGDAGAMFANPAGIATIRHLSLERSEEHTSELQSRSDLVCRLLLEKKNSHLTERRRAPMPG